jgi:hypothetical protein
MMEASIVLLPVEPGSLDDRRHLISPNGTLSDAQLVIGRNRVDGVEKNVDIEALRTALMSSRSSKLGD